MESIVAPSQPGVHPYVVVRDVIPAYARDAALKRINGQFYHGLPHHEVDRAIREACWFPWIREHEAIMRLVDFLPKEWKDDRLCEPQIVLRLPHMDDSRPRFTPHVDEEPPWAEGRKYKRIVGVALTRSRIQDGCLIVWPKGSSDLNNFRDIELDAGDVVVMSPTLEHSPSLNLSGQIRYTVYFRWLANA